MQKRNYTRSEPDWPHNSEKLKEAFPSYPCVDCSQNGRCSYHTKCHKWRRWLTVAWGQVTNTLKDIMRHEKETYGGPTKQ